MCKIADVRRHVESVGDSRYRAYEEAFAGLVPHTDADLFRRFLFVFLSVNMPWEHNVSLYNKLKSLWWFDSPGKVRKVFLDERCGLENTRSVQIVDFANVFVEHPKWFWKTAEESADRYRERMMDAVPGLGITKVSFLMELVYPDSACVCLDRHMLKRVFGYFRPDRPAEGRYRRYENIWVRESRGMQRKPGITRMACWDALLGYTSHTFWSSCMAA